MKNIKIDPYKSIFLLILAVFVYCYYLNIKIVEEKNKIGRYTVINGNGLRILILDTKSGATYQTKEPFFENNRSHKVYENSHSLIK
jgi:hypothetical protein